MKLLSRSILLGVVGGGLGGCFGLGTTTDSFAPVIDLTSPLSQQVRGRVDYSAEVFDDTGVARVRFLIDGVLLFEDKSAPYITDWLTTGFADGPHTLRVEAEDDSGNQASVTRAVTVNNAAPS
jgi:hypothetical protein